MSLPSTMFSAFVVSTACITLFAKVYRVDGLGFRLPNALAETAYGIMLFDRSGDFRVGSNREVSRPRPLQLLDHSKQTFLVIEKLVLHKLLLKSPAPADHHKQH